jgi:hypothetical protein
MIGIKITKKTKKLESIKTAIKKIDGQGVEIGYFASQGIHKGGWGTREYSYAALAQALSLGWFPATSESRKPMPFMKHIMERTVIGMVRSTKVRRAFRNWGRNLEKKASPSTWLDAVGEYAILQSKQVFNNPSYFPQAPSNKTPNWETGDLAKHFTYRTTFNNRVRRV